jgi:ORF6N domain
MFKLTAAEAAALRSQFATSNISRGGRRSLPYAFTEHGVVMLSAVLNSHQAVQVSILVVNAFIRMRELIASNKDIAARVEKLERGQSRTVSVIEVLVEDIDRLAHELKEMKAVPPVPKRKIGFRLGEDD